MSEMLLDYYMRKSISTEHGVDDEWDKHLARRRKLYRQLGIPILALRGSNALEVGPGSGHNTLPLLTEWDVIHIDLLEPNETARKELEDKLKSNNVPEERYKIYPDALDEYKSSEKYDLVIAEGFLHCDERWREYLTILEGFTHKDSIVIVTCTDEISCYVEKMKKAVMQYLVRDIEEDDEKVKVLVKIMELQLRSLKGMSRSIEDWVRDQIFYTMGSELMTMGKAIEHYGEKFDVLGASQNIFVDHSWYKDFEYDYISSYIRQYDEKKHMFLVAGDDHETYRTAEENQKLEDAIKRADCIARKIEKGHGDIAELTEAIQYVTENTINPAIAEFNRELIEIINRIRNKETINWAEYETYGKCFGKTMQYISFIKK